MSRFPRSNVLGVNLELQPIRGAEACQWETIGVEPRTMLVGQHDPFANVAEHDAFANVTEHDAFANIAEHDSLANVAEHDSLANVAEHDAFEFG